MKHNWQHLVFDLESPTDREKWLSVEGRSLPLVHETDPVGHAELCHDLHEGEFGADLMPWRIYARIPITKFEGDDAEIDFSGLTDALEMMKRAAAHASSKPTSERPSKPPPSKPKSRAKGRRS